MMLGGWVSLKLAERGVLIFAPTATFEREREGKTLDDKCITTWTPGAVGPWLVWQGGDDWFASTESSHQWWNHSEPGDQDKKWQNDKLKKKIFRTSSASPLWLRPLPPFRARLFELIVWCCKNYHWSTPSWYHNHNVIFHIPVRYECFVLLWTTSPRRETSCDLTSRC